MVRDVLKPKIYKDNDTLNLLYSIQSDELQRIRNKMIEIYNNSTIEKCDDKYIDRWEEILDVSAISTILSERKEQCLNKLKYRPPFTRHKLRELLVQLYGENNFTFEIDYDLCQVIIDIFELDWEFYLLFLDEVRAIIPANMNILYAIMYTYIYLYRYYTYGELKKFTYGELGQYNKSGV